MLKDIKNRLKVSKKGVVRAEAAAVVSPCTAAPSKISRPLSARVTLAQLRRGCRAVEPLTHHVAPHRPPLLAGAD